MANKPYGRKNQRQIDPVKLGHAMAVADIGYGDIVEALGRYGKTEFSGIAHTKMLRGLCPAPKTWTAICNLLRVPLNAFDLPKEEGQAQALAQWHRDVRENLGMGPHPDDASSQRVTSAERGYFYRHIVQSLLASDSGKSPARPQTVDEVRSALLAKVATLVECLQAMHAPSAPLQFPQGPQSASVPSASGRSRRKRPAGQSPLGKAQPAGAKMPGSGSSTKAAMPPSAKQAAKPLPLV